MQSTGPYHSIPHPSHPLLSIHNVPKFKERWQYTVYTVCKYVCIYCISVYLYVYNLMYLMYLYWPAYLSIYIYNYLISRVSLYKQTSVRDNKPKKGTWRESPDRGLGAAVKAILWQDHLPQWKTVANKQCHGATSTYPPGNDQISLPKAVGSIVGGTCKPPWSGTLSG